MTRRTRFVIDHVNSVIASETRDPNAQVISELIQRALSDGDGFSFVQQQRPDPGFYKRLLRCNAEQRAALLAKKGKESGLFRIAFDDLREVLGDFEGPGMQPGDAGAPGKKSRLAARLEALNLCLEVAPQASRKAVNTILCKHLGSAPLHMRNPVDAVYTFTLNSRDARAENFRTLGQQHAFIDRQLKLIDGLYAARKQPSQKIPSFDEACRMESADFAEWYIRALADRSLLRLTMNDQKKGADEENDDAQVETDLHHIAVELILAAPDSRAALIARKHSNRRNYERADRLLRSIIGEGYSGSAEKSPLHFRARQSMESKKEERATALRQRRDDLDLALGVTPALDAAGVNRLLTEALGVPALDAHRAADAVYAYLLGIRAKQMPGLEQQRAFVRELFARAEVESNWGTPLLSSTQYIAASLDEIDPGDEEGFEDWLADSIDGMDRIDHHYWARVHFSDSLKKIARNNDAARLTTLTSATLDNLDRASAADKVAWNLNEYRTMDAQVLKESLYRMIETENSMRSDGHYIARLLQHATGVAPKSEQEEAPSITQGQSYLSAMEIMTDGLGLDFYNIWHAIGVQYLLNLKGELPEDFPERNRWREYHARMTAGGDSLNDALWVHMDDEPEYLAALRKYAAAGALPADCAAQIRAVTEAAGKYESLIGRSAMLYIMSDWHYACIGGTYSPGSKAGSEPDSEARRIERVTSRTNRVYGEDRTDVPDVPRGLLILSELARINASPSGRYTASQLVKHVDRVLADCGYAMLDVRRRLDYMFYCAIRIAEVHAGHEQFFFDHVLSGLHEYIRSHIFSGLVNDLLVLYDFDPYPCEGDTDEIR